MDSTGTLTRGAVCIRCHEYTILVIDQDIPEECKTENFLSKLDTIILLRWTTGSDVSVSQLLTEIINYRIRQLSGLSSPTIPQMYSKLCCIILPDTTCIWNHTTTTSGASHPEHSSQHSASCGTLNLAMELGVHVVQIGSAPKSCGTSVQLQNNYNCQPLFRTNNFIHQRSFGSHRAKQPTREKSVGIVLYQKYGVGCLQLVPVFAPSSEETPGFSALFRWTPYRTAWSTMEPGNYCLICCAQEAQQCCTETPMSNTQGQVLKPSSNLASVRKLQVLMETLASTCREDLSKTKSSKANVANPIRFRSELKQSQSFATRSTPTAELKKSYSRQSAKLKTDTSKETSAKLPQDPAIKINEPNDRRVDTTGLELSRELKLKEIGENEQCCGMASEDKCPQPVKDRGMELEHYPLNGNMPCDPSEIIVERGTQFVAAANPKMHKSISYPVSLDWNTHGYIRQTSGLNGVTASGSVLCCATVLLAIPEVGESDYYPESPQCLTVDDLRMLGMDDDEDDEGGEGDADSSE